MAKVITLYLYKSEWYPVSGIDADYGQKVEVTLDDSDDLVNLMDIRDKAQARIASILEKYDL